MKSYVIFNGTEIPSSEKFTEFVNKMPYKDGLYGDDLTCRVEIDDDDSADLYIGTLQEGQSIDEMCDWWSLVDCEDNLTLHTYEDMDSFDIDTLCYVNSNLDNLIDIVDDIRRGRQHNERLKVQTIN